MSQRFLQLAWRP